jgi:hypothetical protein
MGLLRFARKDKWRRWGHCEEYSDEAISINLTFAIGSEAREFAFLRLNACGCKEKYRRILLSTKKGTGSPVPFFVDRVITSQPVPVQLAVLLLFFAPPAELRKTRYSYSTIP